MGMYPKELNQWQRFASTGEEESGSSDESSTDDAESVPSDVEMVDREIDVEDGIEIADGEVVSSLNPEAMDWVEKLKVVDQDGVVNEVVEVLGEGSVVDRGLVVDSNRVRGEEAVQVQGEVIGRVGDSDSDDTKEYAESMDEDYLDEDDKDVETFTQNRRRIRPPAKFTYNELGIPSVVNKF